MTQQPPSPAEIEAFLPPDNAYLDLHDLLKGYGKYWISQPSVSHYKRYYDTNAIKDLGVYQLLLWEGYPGSYDYYGDFADDDHFYNQVAMDIMLFFHLSVSKTNGSIGVRVDRLQKSYASVSALRQAMINAWHDIAPTLGEGGAGRRQLIEDYGLPVFSLLREYGQAWQAAQNRDDAHMIIHVFDIYIYLVRWYGAAEAVFTAADSPHRDGRPGLHHAQIERFCEIRVGFKRVPVRFDLEGRRWNLEYRTTYYADLVESSLRSFGALQTALADVFPTLHFYEPPKQKS